MFGFSKREMEDKLNELQKIAMVSVFKYIATKSFKVNGAILEDEENEVFSAAVTNYFFVKEHSQQHLDKFTSAQIASAGLQIIKSDENLREVVVQTQKVIFILQYGWEPNNYPNLTQILTMYGEEFSKVPNPASYELLIRTWDSKHSGVFPN